MKKLLSLFLSLLLLCVFSLSASAKDERVVIVPAKAPKTVGPYSQGIAYGSLIFTSGQIPLNPESNNMPEGIEAQARQSLDNVKDILEASGSSLDKVCPKRWSLWATSP